MTSWLNALMFTYSVVSVDIETGAVLLLTSLTV